MPSIPFKNKTLVIAAKTTKKQIPRFFGPLHFSLISSLSSINFFRYCIWDQVFKTGLSKFLKAVFHKLCLVHSWILCSYRALSNIYGVARSSRSEVFLKQGILKISSKFTGDHPCRNAILIKLQSNFIEITLRHGCFPVNLLHVFRTPFLKNASGRLLLWSYLQK